ncbi:MAG TPA: hypothetical protein VH277_06200 [Gemmatimonadaceae bacterium]|jgi:hypothetical protein|nr:hypothetical protein [Gemmatimonadaceae bacterium]
MMSSELTRASGAHRSPLTSRRSPLTSRRSALAIALLAVASSLVGIVNRFTYDDRYIVELNPFVHGMHQWWKVFGRSYWPKDWGGDGYRPLTILMFKIESVIGNGSPMPYHAANILLYALVSLMVLFLARRLLPAWAAWVVAALFAVHPVHVEAVANVVGQSELLVALFMLPAVLLYIRERERATRGEAGNATLAPRAMLAIVALYAAACFSKENGVVLPGLLGMAELILVRDERPWRDRIRALRPFYLVLVAVAVAFVAMRAHVLADHDIGGFQPFMPFAALHTTSFQRVLTAIGVVPQWLRLFYWPAHLSSEYGPPEIEIAQRLSITQLPGFLLLAAILALAVMLYRRRPVISFGIAFVCVALLPVSNFIVPAGIVLAERTLLLPSVGALLVVGGMLAAMRQELAVRDQFQAGATRLAQAAFAGLLIAGVVRSAMRTRVWSANETLFNQAVIDSPASYRAHYMLGAWSFEKNRKSLGEAEYRKALSLFPFDPYLSYTLAEQYRTAGQCEPALPLYKASRELDPQFPFGRTAYAWCLMQTGRFEEARAATRVAVAGGGSVRVVHDILRQVDSAEVANPRANGEKAPISLARAPSKVPQTMQKAGAK